MGVNPARHSNNVVLPAPFGPIRPKISFCRTEKETSRSAQCAPKRLLTPLAPSTIISLWVLIYLTSAHVGYANGTPSLACLDKSPNLEACHECHSCRGAI